MDTKIDKSRSEIESLWAAYEKARQPSEVIIERFKRDGAKNFGKLCRCGHLLDRCDDLCRECRGYKSLTM